MVNARIGESLIVRSVIFGLAYLAGAEIGHVLSFQVESHRFATYWPPAGLFLAALALSRFSAWTPLVLAACCANLTSDVLIHDKSLPASITFCAAYTIEACLGAFLVRFFVGAMSGMATVKEVLTLAWTSVVLAPAIGAAIGTALVTTPFSDEFWSAWKAWWIADGVGVLLIAPVVLAWVNAPLAATFRRTLLVEVFILFACLILVTQGVYGNWLPRSFRVPIVILPFLLWAALRLGPRGAVCAILVVALVGVWHASRGRGPFAFDGAPSVESLLRTQASLGLASLCVLLLAAMVAQRKQAEAELQAALAEIKALRGLIPICAWCKRVRDDQNFWTTVEDYVSKHTDARFSHGMCPECLKREMDGNAEADS